MKQFVLIIFLLLPARVLLAQDEKSDIHKGNQLYQQQKYKEAEENYRRSVAKKDKNVAGNFNLGDALYKQKKFDEAGQQFNNIATASGNKAVAAGAYHNLGNSLLQGKKYQESIDAYKKSLLNNPKDDQTCYNLAYAQQMLKKQQQQQKQQDKNDKNKDKNDKDKQNKDQDKKDQDKKDQDKNKDQNKPGQNKDQKNGEQPQQNKLSKQDAQRMLDALNNDEQKTQDKLKNKKLKGAKVHIDKDW